MAFLLLRLLGKSGARFIAFWNIRLRQVNKKHKMYLPEKHILRYLKRESKKGFTRLFAGHFHTRATYKLQNGTRLEMIPAFFIRQEIGLYHAESDRLELARWQTFVERHKSE